MSSFYPRRGHRGLLLSSAHRCRRGTVVDGLVQRLLVLVRSGFRSRTNFFAVPLKAYGALSRYAFSTVLPLSRPLSMPA